MESRGVTMLSVGIGLLAFGLVAMGFVYVLEEPVTCDCPRCRDRAGNEDWEP